MSEGHPDVSAEVEKLQAALRRFASIPHEVRTRQAMLSSFTALEKGDEEAARAVLADLPDAERDRVIRWAAWACGFGEGSLGAKVPGG